MTGSVKTIKFDRGYGFITYADGDIFFHCRETDRSLDFDDRLIELPVEFEIVNSGGKSRAINVRAVA